MNFWNIDKIANKENYLKAIVDCTNTMEDLATEHPNAYKLYNQCANAVFIETFLYDQDTLNLHDKQLTVTPNINNHDLTWTLGYVLLNT